MSKKAAEELRLQEIVTSVYNNNSLAFAILMATGQLEISQNAKKAKELSDNKRDEAHNLIMNRLPADASTREGNNDEWWFGQSKTKLQKIYDEKGLMNEAHVHGFANVFNCSIVTLDVCQDVLIISEYTPGYAVARQLLLDEAKEQRKQEKQPVWLQMKSEGHWSYLRICE